MGSWVDKEEMLNEMMGEWENGYGVKRRIYRCVGEWNKS